ncbi:uncharacterized protein C10orf105-like [Alosa alosa]|uniref:uncharacterized protein C10orf105-like n=1 Tax=Alosa sapidissima TaxID=34773 RepID=UPI001C08A398|nr:uncharacterized protein C10orf105-like [Alosa sapidissima]XP_048125211.1 uncharacterized protein C10orf105-like [Alosa alosa]
MSNLPFNISSFLSAQDAPPSNLSLLVNSTTPVLPMTTHDPLPIIIIAACLFLLFGGCIAFLAVCCSGDPPDGGCESGCSPAEGLSCGTPRSSEPQLKLWKRLGSMRRSVSSSSSSSSVRRSTPQRRSPPPISAPLIMVTPPTATATTPQRHNLPPHIAMPCLLQYATEI